MPIKDYYAYLYTRSTKSEQPEKGVYPKTKLGVRAIAYGRELTATLPLMVSVNFSNYYNSDGTLREGFKAVSLRERFERDSVLLAYKAVCNVVKYMLSISRDYWLLSPSARFSELVNHEFYNLCEGLSSWVKQLKENDTQQKKNGLTPLSLKELEIWRNSEGGAY